MDESILLPQRIYRVIPTSPRFGGLVRFLICRSLATSDGEVVCMAQSRLVIAGMPSSLTRTFKCQVSLIMASDVAPSGFPV